jgi:hypothetical protein
LFFSCLVKTIESFDEAVGKHFILFLEGPCDPLSFSDPLLVGTQDEFM